MKKPTIALVHDYLREYGGGERVLEALNEIWHDAPIYTSTFEHEIMEKYNFKVPGGLIHTTFLQNLPFRYKLRKHYFFLYPHAFKSLKINSDIIFSTCSYASKFAKPKEGGIHISYIHSVPKFLWGYDTETRDLEVLPFDKYFKPIYRKILPLVKEKLRKMDYDAASKLDYVIANSKITKERIKKHYNRDSVVIYPPVDINEFKGEATDKGYFLILSRLSKFKKLEIAIEAFNKLKKPLKIAGDGQETANLKRLAHSNVEFLGGVDRKKIPELLRGCTALIFPTEEDFGIVPVEAMAAGKPVIAYRGGGALETVVEGKTGEFFDEQNADSLISVLKNFDPKRYNVADCVEQASRFSKEEFKTNIKNFVDKILTSNEG